MLELSAAEAHSLTFLGSPRRRNSAQHSGRVVAGRVVPPSFLDQAGVGSSPTACTSRSRKMRRGHRTGALGRCAATAECSAPLCGNLRGNIRTSRWPSLGLPYDGGLGNKLGKQRGDVQA